MATSISMPPTSTAGWAGPCQVCSRAAVVAIGVNADGRRELLGLQVDYSKSEGFWKSLIGSLISARLIGLTRVLLFRRQPDQ